MVVTAQIVPKGRDDTTIRGHSWIGPPWASGTSTSAFATKSPIDDGLRSLSSSGRVSDARADFFTSSVAAVGRHK